MGPETYLLYLNLGGSYRRSSQLPQALQSYRKGLELAEAELVKNPKDGYVNACLAYLCARMGQRQRAAVEAARALGMSSGAQNVRWMAALTYETLGQRERTLTLIQDAPEDLLRRLNGFQDLADLQKDSRFRELLASRNIK